MNTPVVSWNTYAQKYDMLMHYNPFYQKLHQDVFKLIQDWQIHAGDQIVDLGAGTGNYSISLAEYFPQAQILHIDKDQGMNAITKEKIKSKEITNLKIVEAGIDEVQIAPASLQALISIHALYAFPSPAKAISKIYTWIEPGGQVLLVDAGRIVKVLNWQAVLAWHFLKHYGLKKTMQIFREGKEVSRQNAYIRRMQRDGVFWTHTHEEFLEVVRESGFKILDSGITFRGVSDWVVAEKE